MLEIIKVIILGIIEGITEWLPISSTGHMILVEQFLKLNVSEDYWNMFLVVIQLGAILAVVFLYFGKLWPFQRADRKEKGIYRYLNRGKFTMWLKILVSCIPAIIIGLPFDDWLDEHFYNYPTVAVMLILYGVLFIVVENRNRKRKGSRSWRNTGPIPKGTCRWRGTSTVCMRNRMKRANGTCSGTRESLRKTGRILPGAGRS